MNISHETVDLHGEKVFYRFLKNSTSSRSILLLHGMSFTSADWERHALIERLSDLGFNIVAVDYPGFGKTPDISGYSVKPGDPLKCADFIRDFRESLNVKFHSIIGPSLGGFITLSAVAMYPDVTDTAIAVAPAWTERIEDALRNVQIPILLIWGSRDRIVPLERGRELASSLRSATLKVVDGAGHPVYLEKPDEFLSLVSDFVSS